MYPEMDALAHTILDTLGMGNDGRTHMAYGTIVNELKEVSRSYKEARMALDVGKIFFGDKRSNCLQFPGNRTTDLSASYTAV